MAARPTAPELAPLRSPWRNTGRAGVAEVIGNLVGWVRELVYWSLAGLSWRNESGSTVHTVSSRGGLRGGFRRRGRLLDRKMDFAHCFSRGAAAILCVQQGEGQRRCYVGSIWQVAYGRLGVRDFSYLPRDSIAHRYTHFVRCSLSAKSYRAWADASKRRWFQSDNRRVGVLESLPLRR